MSVPNLTSLLKQSQITDHEEVLRAANASLKASKNDIDAHHAKVVALLKLDRFEDAVRAIEGAGETLKEKATLEYAYALYKSGKRKEAAELSRASKSRGLQHVEAQALYSLEEFVRAAELYKSLSQEAFDDNVADLRVNTLAVNAQLQWHNLGQHVEEKAMTRGDFEAHETVYNTACGSIARGELGQCEVLLNRARSLCENLQDLSDEEKTSELMPITLQQIYVLTRLGKLNEAKLLAETLDASRVTDELTQSLIKINSEATRLDTANPYLLERQLHIDSNSYKLNPPFTFQKSIFDRNQYALDLGVMKFDGTSSATQSKLAETTIPSIDARTNTLSVINAAAHAKNKTGKEALKCIIPLLERRPADVGLVVTVVQLYVLLNNTNSAIELLEKFLAAQNQSPEIAFAPGLVGALVSLYWSQGRREQARSTLGKTATHWRQQSKDLTPGTVHLLKAAGSALLESHETKDHDLAKEVFENLYKRDKYDKYAAAGLLAASSDGSASKVDRSALTTFDKLTAGIDAEELERAGIVQRSTPQETSSRKRPATSEPAPRKRRKIRNSKMPKEYDAAKTPDPERWLPLRDRSTYRPKGKKGKARQAMLSQGAVASESDGSRPVTPGGDILKGKAAVGSSGNNKKKKAKNKK